MTRNQAILAAAPLVGLVCAGVLLALAEDAAPPPPEPAAVVEAPAQRPKPPQPTPQATPPSALDPADPRALAMRHPDPDARDALVQLLYDPEYRVRVQAIRGLSLWDDCGPDVLARLEIEPNRMAQSLLLNALMPRATQDQIKRLNAFANRDEVGQGQKALALAVVEGAYQRAGVASPKEQERLNAQWRAQLEQERTAEDVRRAAEERQREQERREEERRWRREARRR